MNNKGEWIVKKIGNLPPTPYCSVCDMADPHMRSVCPWCGAKMKQHYKNDSGEWQYGYMLQPEDIIANAPTVEQPTGEWIPVKYRPMTTEERKEFAEHYGIEYSDTVDEKMFDCPMPEDGQEVLVSSRWGVHTDVADNDIDGEGFISHGLEENGDWEGIVAWMPLPEPYKE